MTNPFTSLLGKNKQKSTSKITKKSNDKIHSKSKETEDNHLYNQHNKERKYPYNPVPYDMKEPYINPEKHKNKFASFRGGIIIIPSEWEYIEICEPEKSLYAYVVEIYNGSKYGCNHYYFFSNKNSHEINMDNNYNYVINSLKLKFPCVKDALDHEIIVEDHYDIQTHNPLDRFTYTDINGVKHTAAEYKDWGTTLGIFALTDKYCLNHLYRVTKDNVLCNIDDPNLFSVNAVLFCEYYDWYYAEHGVPSINCCSFLLGLYNLYRENDCDGSSISPESMATDCFVNVKKIHDANAFIAQSSDYVLDLVIKRALEIYSTDRNNLIPSYLRKFTPKRREKIAFTDNRILLYVNALVPKFELTHKNNIIYSGNSKKALLITALLTSPNYESTADVLKNQVFSKSDFEYDNKNALSDLISKINHEIMLKCDTTTRFIIRKKNKHGIKIITFNSDFYSIDSDITSFNEQYYTLYEDGFIHVNTQIPYDTIKLYKADFLSQYEVNNTWVAKLRKTYFDMYCFLLKSTCSKIYNDTENEAFHDNSHEIITIMRFYYNIISSTGLNITLPSNGDIREGDLIYLNIACFGFNAFIHSSHNYGIDYINSLYIFMAKKYGQHFSDKYYAYIFNTKPSELSDNFKIYLSQSGINFKSVLD